MKTALHFETERLILRLPQAEDVDAWIAFYTSERAAMLGGGPDSTAEDAWRLFASIIGHWNIRGCGPFLLQRRNGGGDAIGSVGPWYPEGWPEREMSWSMWAADAEGEGYAYEAALRVRRHVFENLGWETTVSYIDAENVRSRRLAERLGCTIDEAAPTPRNEPVLVYRHPKPEGV